MWFSLLLRLAATLLIAFLSERSIYYCKRTSRTPETFNFQSPHTDENVGSEGRSYSMTNEKTAEVADFRPAIVRNWEAFLEKDDFKSGFECPFFGDAHISGEIPNGFGPYQIINGLSGQEDYGTPRQVLVLRCNQYGEAENVSLNKTMDEGYHGGTLPDEVAALISLVLGVRMKAGSINRLFFAGGDPKGIPFGHGSGIPNLLIRGQKPIVPRALGTHELNDSSLAKRLLVLSSKDLIALVRAARYFQDGLWLAESDPALAWILFVSAIEIAANRWREADETPEEKLLESKPKLVSDLKDIGGQELVSRIASEFVPYMGATKKFIDFLHEFRPEPPSIRPMSNYQLSWQDKSYKKAMNKIYAYRSRALHGGKPFPMPMCMPPNDWASDGVPHEVIGHNMGSADAAWNVKDLPMYLHMFVYIVQGSLLNLIG